MAIYFVSGKPGCGKSFWAVHHLTRKYFRWFPEFNEWLPTKDCTIISNVEDLRLDHMELGEMVKVAGGVSVFFTEEYQRKLLARFKRIIYLLDEVGDPLLFPRSFKDERVLFFFQKHRHLGIDFYMMNADLNAVCPRIVGLAEFVWCGAERTKSLLGEFRFTRMVGGVAGGSVSLKPDPKLFSLYRSMSMTEGEKPKPIVWRYFYLATGLGAVAVLIFVLVLTGMGGRVKSASKSKGKRVVGALEGVRDKVKEVRSSGGDVVVKDSGVIPGVRVQPSRVSSGGGAVVPVASVGSPVFSRVSSVGGSPSAVPDLRGFEKVYVYFEGDHAVVYSNSGLIEGQGGLSWALSQGVKQGRELWIPKREPVDRLTGDQAPRSVEAEKVDKQDDFPHKKSLRVGSEKKP